MKVIRKVLDRGTWEKREGKSFRSFFFQILLVIYIQSCSESQIDCATFVSVSTRSQSISCTSGWCHDHGELLHQTRWMNTGTVVVKSTGAAGELKKGDSWFSFQNSGTPSFGIRYVYKKNGDHKPMRDAPQALGQGSMCIYPRRARPSQES